MVETTDGFEIAAATWRSAGPASSWGSRQSGDRVAALCRPAGGCAAVADGAQAGADVAGAVSAAAQAQIQRLAGDQGRVPSSGRRQTGRRPAPGLRGCACRTGCRTRLRRQLLGAQAHTRTADHQLVAVWAGPGRWCCRHWPGSGPSPPSGAAHHGAGAPLGIPSNLGVDHRLSGSRCGLATGQRRGALTWAEAAS